MKPEGKRAVTIYQIAKHVGVSPAAVSSVLANRHVERRLSAATVSRIREAIRELNYIPNMAGRRLRAHEAGTRQIDLAILTSFEAPLLLVDQALHALQMAVDCEATADLRYAVSIEMFHAGRLREKPGLLHANRFHGVIITNTVAADDEFLAATRLPYAVVVLGRRIVGYHCVLEVPDFVGRRAAETLVASGCRRPAVLHGSLLTQATSNRVAAFVQTCRSLGCEPAEIVSPTLKVSDGATALRVFFDQGGACDGIFTVTDALAVGAYRVIKQRGLGIPRDVSIVGVGDHEWAEFFDPPLSTVAGANDAMVAEAVPLLFRLLHGEKDVMREVLVVPPVYMRASTGFRSAESPPAL